MARGRVLLKRTLPREFGDTYHAELVVCPRCGRELALYCNGGELDGATCCGLQFSLESTGTRLVIREERQ